MPAIINMIYGFAVNCNVQISPRLLRQPSFSRISSRPLFFRPNNNDGGFFNTVYGVDVTFSTVATGVSVRTCPTSAVEFFKGCEQVRHLRKLFLQSVRANPHFTPGFIFCHEELTLDVLRSFNQGDDSGVALLQYYPVTAK